MVSLLRHIPVQAMWWRAGHLSQVIKKILKVSWNTRISSLRHQPQKPRLGFG